jgi:hypothetical protein
MVVAVGTGWRSVDQLGRGPDRTIQAQTPNLSSGVKSRLDSHLAAHCRNEMQSQDLNIPLEFSRKK